MRVHSDRRHRFDVSSHDLWAAIGDVDSYPTWWPWLRSFDGTRLAVGQAWRATVQPPLPYVVRVCVHIDSITPEQAVEATVTGDLQGSARLELTATADGGCEARLRSDLAPTSRALQAVAVVAAPIVRYGHDWVLDTGARQFRSRAFPPA